MGSRHEIPFTTIVIARYQLFSPLASLFFNISLIYARDCTINCMSLPEGNVIGAIGKRI